VQRILVESEQLDSVGYNAGRSEMEIEFRNGDIIRYMSVPAPTYLALMNADEKDAYFEKHVKNEFVFLVAKK